MCTGQNGLDRTLHHSRAELKANIIMTSNERHEARYQRRRAHRDQKKQERSDALGGVAGVYTYNAMFKAGRKCCNGVRWKQSTQNFERHLFSGTAACRRKILNGTWKPDKYFHFPIRERGKERPIDAPRVQDRQVHKVLARDVLLPLYAPDMIFNNCASIPGKGFALSRSLLVADLVQHFKRYGRAGTVITTDFKQYFPTAPHATIYKRHAKLIRDDELRDLADGIVATVPGGVGLPLGVEPSQAEMVALPSPLDNFIKCQLGIKGAGHYMDDYYILVPPDRDPVQILALIIEKAEALGLHISIAKTHITPLTKPFKFCKAKYTLTETGRVIVNGNRDSAARARRKFKALKEKYDAGEITLKDVIADVQSNFAYFESYDDHGRILKLARLLHALFGLTLDDVRPKRKKTKQETDPCVLSYIGDFGPWE